MNSAINWFELPVKDLARAQKFYETMLAIQLRFEVFNGVPTAVFPADSGVGGALVKDLRRKPTADGAVVYFNAEGKLDACLSRVDAAGGKVLSPKMSIGDPGHIALVLDTEGNEIGLHTGPS